MKNDDNDENFDKLTVYDSLTGEPKGYFYLEKNDQESASEDLAHTPNSYCTNATDASQLIEENVAKIDVASRNEHDSLLQNWIANVQADYT